MPINNAPTASMKATGSTSFFPNRKSKQTYEAKSIQYRVEFVKRFDNVSVNDAKLQTKYGLNLVSEYLNLKEDYIKLKQRTKKESILHTDRVYYVRRLNKVIGKLCIREQRTFKGTHLIFIYKSRIRVTKKKVDD